MTAVIEDFPPTITDLAVTGDTVSWWQDAVERRMWTVLARTPGLGGWHAMVIGRPGTDHDYLSVVDGTSAVADEDPGSLPLVRRPGIVWAFRGSRRISRWCSSPPPSPAGACCACPTAGAATTICSTTPGPGFRWCATQALASRSCRPRPGGGWPPTWAPNVAARAISGGGEHVVVIDSDTLEQHVVAGDRPGCTVSQLAAPLSLRWYRAADGARQPLYVSGDPDVTAYAPVVVMPHGGPGGLLTTPLERALERLCLAGELVVVRAVTRSPRRAYDDLLAGARKAREIVANGRFGSWAHPEHERELLERLRREPGAPPELSEFAMGHIERIGCPEAARAVEETVRFVAVSG